MPKIIPEQILFWAVCNDEEILIMGVKTKG
jgi:hypothetical protein